MKPGETDTAGRRWCSSPFQRGPLTTGAIQGVWLYTGEDVEWTWSADGSHIIGYTKKKPSTPAEQPLTCPKCRADLVHDENNAFNRCLSCGWYEGRK